MGEATVGCRGPATVAPPTAGACRWHKAYYGTRTGDRSIARAFSGVVAKLAVVWVAWRLSYRASFLQGPIASGLTAGAVKG